MTLFDLFTANAEWDTETELTISYNHLGDTKWDSGEALDMTPTIMSSTGWSR